MSTFKNPVGPQPPRVYWRRRLLVGLGALAVIIVIILILARPGSGSTGNTASPPATNSAVASPSASPQAGGTACLPANIKLEAVTDKNVYAATEQPNIGMKITNTGAADCVINLGSTQQELIITSGTEKIWDSKDCQTAPVDTQITLSPNAPKATPLIPWDRTRSSTTTCNATRTPVTAGGASYHLGVKVGQLASKVTVQFILK
jgi:hypothetical protein